MCSVVWRSQCLRCMAVVSHAPTTGWGHCVRRHTYIPPVPSPSLYMSVALHRNTLCGITSLWAEEWRAVLMPSLAVVYLCDAASACSRNAFTSHTLVLVSLSLCAHHPLQNHPVLSDSAAPPDLCVLDCECLLPLCC